MTDPAQLQPGSGTAWPAGTPSGQALPSDPPLVEAAHIGKEFGSTVALRDVGITVTAGRTHALVGRNGAGKSTLVSVLTGLVRPDSGTVSFAGEPAPAFGDRAAWQARVACVYQKSTIIPDLSVAENLFLNRQGGGRPLINWRRLRREAERVLQAWKVDVDVEVDAGKLSVEQRQLLEIARALSHGARFIILDEPTAQLDGAAIKRLFGRITDLQSGGVTFLFISHHLSEVYEICADVTVLRDARRIVSAPVAQLDKDAMIEAMTGERVTAVAQGSRTVGSTVALAVNGLSAPGLYDDVSFTVAQGEIVGLAGGGTSGKSELAETIVGLRRPRSGRVAVGAAIPAPGNVTAALRAGVGFVPQDRHIEGLVDTMSVADNATLTVPRRISKRGLLSRPARNQIAVQAIADLDIKTSGPEQTVDGLSGGNQQKVVMARAMASDPAAMVLIAPTAGVDVASKRTLMEAVTSAADSGRAALVVTDEIDDLRYCDRVLVMYHGRITGEFSRGFDDNRLIAAMEGLDS